MIMAQRSRIADAASRKTDTDGQMRRRGSARQRLERAAFMLPWLCSFLAGCDGGDDASVAQKPRAPKELVPESVLIVGADTVAATALMKSRPTATVASFRISKAPTSVAQYRQCMELGGCQTPAWDRGMCLQSRTGIDGPTLAQLSADAGPNGSDLAQTTPVTCVSPKQAKAYCAWVGGRLPAPEEWLLAVRGRDMHRFAWGDDPLTCERHWRIAFDGTRAGACCGGECSSLAEQRVQKSDLPAPASGLAQVLWTMSELVAAGERAVLHSCPSSVAGCVVRGLVPAAIDSIVSISNLETTNPTLVDSANLAQEPASFRCVWEEAS